ncbi:MULTISPECIES: tRNA adenosine deaminase-associated protein [Brevibacterium]|uniref:tRNA adenosine deaminase-associated protein n=2 Tax=Brevibacterium TaxID=1696 RepID=A0A1H1NC55_BRESA|nr:tRNA adenosine deaminase-associated protein [Brevibacterium sandarakinum]MDN5657309.1 tRNA adenosine deaminase-associated protein [Brevibacterium sandarakinum]SDR96470.1 putative tRNA adenosine deaminase-associated protein [Brevibacterium sandarakinum]
MSYFTEILAESSDGFRALDVDVRDASDLDSLVDMMQAAGAEDGESVAVIEHEDEWFGLVRVCDNNEVKVFLSDLRAVELSPFAEIFADFLDAQPDAYEAEPEEEFGLEEDETADDDDDDDEDVAMLEFDADAEWAGDAEIYADRGVLAADLIEQVEKYRSDPARVVAHVGETVGFADQLEAAR